MRRPPRVRRGLATVLMFLACLAAFSSGASAQTGEPAPAAFADPPKEARPSAYWLWLNGYVNRDHLEAELEVR